MRAIQVRRTGGPEVLELCERPTGMIDPGSARVRVLAAGVNYIDVYERTGMYPRALPYLAGGEGVGIVTEVAANTFEVAVGDRVAWQGVPGSYAEELTAPIGQLLSVPTAINDHVAAALPLQGLTAHYLATESYSTGPGDTVVVHAGAGGVGLLLTQIAKLRGARVITTVSNPEKARLSRHAGADAAVPYRELRAEVDKATGGRGVQAVFDSVGEDTFDTSLEVLATRGTLVLYGASSGPPAPFELDRLRRGGSLRVTRPTLRDFVATRDELTRRAAELFTWVADERLRVHVGGTYPLASASEAHEDLEARRTTGKLLLRP